MGFAGHFDGIDRSLSVGFAGHFEWDYAVTSGGIKQLAQYIELYPVSACRIS